MADQSAIIPWVPRNGCLIINFSILEMYIFEESGRSSGSSEGMHSSPVGATRLNVHSSAHLDLD